jgi:single-strand DNA-binding protein
MANVNKVILIGRLTRDPEVRMFATGGKVAHFGFAVNNRKKNNQTGQWEDDPVWLDVDAFNRGETGKMADNVEQYYRKGHQAYIEGHLRLDQWTGQDGQKRQKIKIVADYLQNLEPRGDGAGRQGAQRGSAPMDSSPMGDGGFDAPPPDDLPPPPAGRGTEDIPF